MWELSPTRALLCRYWLYWKSAVRVRESQLGVIIVASLVPVSVWVVCPPVALSC